MKEISNKILKVQEEISCIKKTAENPFFRSNYADFGSIIRAVRPVMVRAGIALIQSPIYSEEGAGCKTQLIDVESGEVVESYLVLPITKKDAQGVGSAISYAKRYALTAMLGIATADEDDDAEGTTETVGRKKELTHEYNLIEVFQDEEKKEKLKKLLKKLEIAQVAHEINGEILTCATEVSALKKYEVR